jgi:G3E family GTPase
MNTFYYRFIFEGNENFHMNSTVEVVILSGFLGSGKTTLLQKLLAAEKEKERKIAVVMNEVGRVSIDSTLLPNETLLKELLNGCVCCTLSGKLELQLNDLLHRNHLDVIYIETTGIAHPMEVLETCLSPLLADKIKIHSICTVLDATSWMDRRKFKVPIQKLITEQVKHADVIVLNKIDRTSEITAGEIAEELRGLNKSARIIPAEYTNVDTEELLTKRATGRKDWEALHAVEHLHVKTYVHTFERPINEQLFENFLRDMPENIYRIKGYVQFEGNPTTILFQYSYGVSYQTDPGIRMKTLLVFIGDDLDHEKLFASLTHLENATSKP